MRNPFRYFNSSPEVIRLVVMMYIRYPLSLQRVEDILFERGIDICHETVRYWWNRFGPMFAAAIKKRNHFNHDRHLGGKADVVQAPRQGQLLTQSERSHIIAGP